MAKTEQKIKIRAWRKKHELAKRQRVQPGYGSLKKPKADRAEADKSPQQKYVEKYPDKVRASKAAYRKTLRTSKRHIHMAEMVRTRAWHCGVQCTLTKDWFEERINIGTCELSGMPFDMVGVRTPFAPTIDRIDPDGSYTPENCRMIIWWLNRALCDNGLDLAIDIFKRVIAKRETDG